MLQYMKRALLFFSLALLARAQYSPEEMLKTHVYTNAFGEVFPYRMSAPQFPAADRRYPLILFLHGSGECGSDNLKQIKVGLPALMKSLLKRPDPVIVVAPQCQTGNWWVRRLARQADYTASKEAMPSLEVALELCRHVAGQGLADTNRIYITGLSLGGFGVWDAIQRAPGMFAAAVPVCGGGDIRRVSLIRDLPVWVFHGTADKNVPLECSRRIVEALRQAGSRSVRYTEYEGAAHNVWDRAYADPELIDWMLSQTRFKKTWWKFW